MSDSLPARGGAGHIDETVSRPVREPRHPHVMKCRQCSEDYPGATLVCPRCGKLNERSILIRGLKVLALLLFIGAASWAGWVASTAEKFPSAGETKPLPEAAPNLSGQTDPGQKDLRF